MNALPTGSLGGPTAMPASSTGSRLLVRDPTRRLDPFLATGLRSFQPGVPGSVRQITTDPTDVDPQVSPDGRLIVFRRATSRLLNESEYGIFVANVDGSEVRQLTDGGPGGGSDIEPIFYPSAKRVAFIRLGGSEDREGHGDIYSIGVDGSVRADGTHVRALTNGGRTFPRQGGYDEPAFSPTGDSVIAVARAGSGPRLVRVRFDDPAHPRPLGEGFGRAPAWASMR